MGDISNLTQIIGLIAGLLIAITIHEAAHAWAAYKLGDPTAKNMGRLSLNPLAHLDPIGTLMLIVFRFGWGKPVQMNPNNFKNPKVDAMLSALAGPFSNFLLAIIFGLIIRLDVLPGPWQIILLAIVTINLFLGIFNLIPIPPLDGSKLLYPFISYESQTTMERYGPWLLLAVIFVSYTGFPQIFSALINIVNYFLTLIIG